MSFNAHVHQIPEGSRERTNLERTLGLAQRVLLELDHGREEGREVFMLRIRDDGCGLDATVAAAGRRSGHWGLPGMRERAAAIGAAWRLDSAPGKGTSVQLEIAAELAYPGRRSAALFNRLRPRSRTPAQAA